MKMWKFNNDMSCIFLDENNRCEIHAKHGQEAKPHTCRLYPEFDKKKVADRDYFFYEYGGKVFTRDLMAKMLNNLKRTSKPYLFEMFLDELELLKKQRGKYVDFFNFDDSKRPSALGKSFARRKAKKTLEKKFKDEERKEFKDMDIRAKLNVRELIEEIQKGIPTDQALNPNFPEMLLAYFYLLHVSNPRDSKALADHFFRWNSKRF
jgi:Fe-S-cluster containining protein